MSPLPTIPHDPERWPETEMRRRAEAFQTRMARRRSVREFSTEPVPRELIELAILTAASAPSGAHRQPWRFVAVSDPAVKREIRIAAEAEEKASYEGRMSKEWLDALAPLGTDWRKPFLEIVPWIVVVFAELWEERPDGAKVKNYYVQGERRPRRAASSSPPCTTIGLATLTHTPSPMAFLNEILDRPGEREAVRPVPRRLPGARVHASPTSSASRSTR